MAQWIKNLHPIQETQEMQVRSLRPLKEEMATHSTILAMKDPMDKEACLCCACSATHSCSTLWDPMDCSLPGSSCLWNFSKKEYWSGLSRLLPGNLPNPGIEPCLLHLLHQQADSLLLAPPGKPKNTGMCSLTLLQGIFPTQESTGSLTLQVDSLPVELPETPVWYVFHSDWLSPESKRGSYNTFLRFACICA